MNNVPAGTLTSNDIRNFKIMANDNLIPVNIVVADRTYRLRIKPEEEETIRKTMKEVNDKILEFKTAYAGKDLQDYICMCLILYATQPVTAGGNDLPEDLEKRIAGMNTLIDQALHS